MAGAHPPFLILYGDKDRPGRARTREQMAKALVGAGNSADVHEIADHAHMDMITGIMSPSDPGLKFMLGVRPEESVASGFSRTVVVRLKADATYERRRRFARGPAGRA